MESVKSVGQGPLGSVRHRWEDNIRNHLNLKVSIRGIELIWPRIGIVGGPL